MLNNPTYRYFFRTIPNGILRIAKWIGDNRRPLHDLIVILIILGLFLPIFLSSDMAERLYDFSRSHEVWQLDEIILSLVVISVFIAIFATRRWLDATSFLKRSNTDMLTGLNNRRKGGEVLEQEIQRSRRYHRPLSLIMFDIDHFKNFNDSFGHQAGDSVLKKVSQIVQGELRKTDTLVRWGGDEFLIICVETDLETAGQLAERLRKKIESNPLQGLWNMSASFGVAEFMNDDDFNSFTRRVDDCLYEAKTQGKNRVA